MRYPDHTCALARRIKKAIEKGMSEVLVEPDDLPRGVDSVEWISTRGYMRAPVVARDGLRFVDVSRAKRVFAADPMPVFTTKQASLARLGGIG